MRISYKLGLARGGLNKGESFDFFYGMAKGRRQVSSVIPLEIGSKQDFHIVLVLPFHLKLPI